MKLWKIPVRHYRRHPWQILFSLLGVALGVAVVIAIDLANDSAAKALELSNTLLTGKASHHIIGGPKGINEDVYIKLRMDLQLDAIAPRIEGYGNVAGKNSKTSQTFQIIGIDVLAEPFLRHHFDQDSADFNLSLFVSKPNTAIMLESTANRLNLYEGSEFSFNVGGVKHNFTLAGIIHDNSIINQNSFGSVMFVDIATAQEVLSMGGRINQIDLAIPETADKQTLIANIQSILPEYATIVTSESQGYALSQMTNAFQLNLTALSLLALIVGIFLIYNTMTFSIVQRRTTFASLRTIGTTRRQIFLIVMLEALVIGIVATGIGLFLGIQLGSSLLNHVTQTINDLYFVVTIQQLQVTGWSLIKGSIIGICATLVAVIPPALEATRTTSQTHMSRSHMEMKYRKTITRFAITGILMGIAGFVILKLPTNNLYVSFTGLFVIVIGFAMLIPLFTLVLIQSIVPIFKARFGNLAAISARGITASFSRTGIAVTSLAIAIATSIGVAIMIHSFRLSVVEWLDQTLHADVYVKPVGINSPAGTGSLSSRWIDKFNALPEVASISIYRNVLIQSSKGATQLNVLQIPHAQLTEFLLLQGDARQIRNDFYNSDIVLISEPYAFHNNLRLYDTVSLITDKGAHDFIVGGIYVDYGSERGIVTLSRMTYLRHWDDKSISSLGIYAKPGVSIQKLKEHLNTVVEKELASPFNQGNIQDLSIHTNREIRDTTESMFDHTFAITQVLRLLAISIAFIGILSALMAIQIERSREIALMRAIGLTPRQVWFITSTETGMIGFLVGVLAMLLGIAIAVVLILVINQRSFGWSMTMSIDPMILVQSLFIAVLAALLAGAYPSYRMSRISPAIALRED